VAAGDEYGVVLTRAEDGFYRPDLEATTNLRQRLAAERGPVPLFDRGPGYRLLSGRPHADVD
jgi:N-methylhydantoinase B